MISSIIIVIHRLVYQGSVTELVYLILQVVKLRFLHFVPQSVSRVERVAVRLEHRFIVLINLF
jgi:hypothetical protein